jgi:hypothetical protein
MVAGLTKTDLEANIARDKYARLCVQVDGLVSSLKTSQSEDDLDDISSQLVCSPPVAFRRAVD